MRDLCILSSRKVQFSACFDELVRVYAWWRYGDEFGNWINKSAAKGKLRHPESFTVSVREEAQYHAVHIIYTLFAQTHIGSCSKFFLELEISNSVGFAGRHYMSSEMPPEVLWGPLFPWTEMQVPFFFCKGILETWEKGSLQMSTGDHSKALGNA